VEFMDFHDKASKVLFQIIVPPKSNVGFLSNLKKFLCRRCRSFSPNFSIIRFVINELHLSKVEGIEIVYFFPNLSKLIFIPKA